MKKVFIGVLAALMLFAFTACEPQQMSYKAVQYVTVAQTADFIEGQTPYAEAFDVTVHYLDGTTDVFPGTGRVGFSTKNAKTVATATIAGESDEIEVRFVAPEAITVTATVANEQTVSYVEGNLPDFDITASVSAATITAGDATWVLNETELDDVDATATLLGANRKVVGTHVCALTVSYDGEEIPTTSTVNVVVKDDPTNPSSPDYEVTPPTPTKADVTSLAVKWTVTPKTGNAVTYTTEDIEVNVTDTVAYTIVGLTKDGKEVTLDQKAGTDFNILSGNTLALTSGSYETTAADITKGEKKALTATIQFIPPKGMENDNYTDDIQLELSVTVNDILDVSTVENIEAAEWLYKGGDLEITKVADQGIKLLASDFTYVAKTVGGDDVTLKGYEFYGIDQTEFTADEVAADEFDEIVINFRWAAQSSDYEATGHADDVTISVVTGA